MKPVIPEGGRVQIIGRRLVETGRGPSPDIGTGESTGKSYQAIDLARALATGTEWHHFQAEHEVPVMYVCSERYREQVRRLRLISSGPPHNLHWSDEPVDLTIPLTEEFATYLVGNRIGVVFFDSYQGCGGGDPAATDQVLKNLARLNRNNIASVIINHTRKPAPGSVREGIGSPVPYGDSKQFNGEDVRILVTRKATSYYSCEISNPKNNLDEEFRAFEFSA